MFLLLCSCTFISAADHAARLAGLEPDTDTDTDADTDTDTDADTDTDSDSDADSDTDTDADPITIDSVVPSYGTDAGGTSVLVTGGPFDDTTEVQFGGSNAEVLTVSKTTLTVRTPESAVDGPVDVGVVGNGTSDRLTDGYTYWMDATGQVGATGELAWTYFVGGYWASSEVDGGYATLRFTEPWDYQFYYYWAPKLDTCTRITNGTPEYEFVPEYTAIDARGGTAHETAPTASVDLAWNAAEVRFTEYNLLEDGIAPGSDYDLSIEGAPGLPEVTLDDVLHLPAKFTVSEPAIFNSSMPTITEDQHIAWTTAETGDAILLQLGMYNNTGSGFEQELFCALRDDGSFTIPDGAWTRWTNGREVHMLIGRYNSGVGLLPWNQGNIATAAEIWNYGAGIAR